jgi:hypothetical protein
MDGGYGKREGDEAEVSGECGGG